MRDLLKNQDFNHYFKFADDSSVYITSNTQFDVYCEVQYYCDQISSKVYLWRMIINAKPGKSEAIIFDFNNLISSPMRKLTLSNLEIEYRQI